MPRPWTDPEDPIHGDHGLTKREWFAGLLMAAQLVAAEVLAEVYGSTFRGEKARHPALRDLAEAADDGADELVLALNRNSQGEEVTQ